MDSSSSAGAGDDRWRLSKKGRSRSGRPHAMDAAAGSVLSRSYSASVSSSRSTAAGTSTAAATGSSAAAPSSQQQQQQQQAGAAACPAESSSSSSSSRLSKKCVEAVKEHRARFYIVRRCVSMLVCWRDY
jgi:hypothetical protein